MSVEFTAGKGTPNPGSPEAVEKGCTCPVIDNHGGKGEPHTLGPRFWISQDCDLHGLP